MMRMNEHMQKASNIDINSLYIGNKPVSVVHPKILQKKADYSRPIMLLFSWISNYIFLGENSIHYILTYVIHNDVHFGLQLFVFDAVVLRFQFFVASLFVEFLQNYEHNELSVLTTILILVELIATVLLLAVHIGIHYAVGFKYEMDFYYILASLSSAVYVSIFKMSILCKKAIRVLGMSIVSFLTLSGISMMYHRFSYFGLYALIYILTGLMLYSYSFVNNERLFSFTLGKIMRQLCQFCELILPAVVVGLGGVIGTADYLILVMYEVQLYGDDMAVVLYTAWMQVLGRQLQFEMASTALLGAAKLGKLELVSYALISFISTLILGVHPILFNESYFGLVNYRDYVLNSFKTMLTSACSAAFLAIIMRYKVYGVQFIIAIFNIIVAVAIILVERFLTIDTTFHEGWIYIAGYSDGIIGFAGLINLFIQQFKRKTEEY